MSSVPDTQNDIELVFDMVNNNPLSEADKEASEYLEFTYVKDSNKGNALVIYNPITEKETVLREVKEAK